MAGKEIPVLPGYVLNIKKLPAFRQRAKYNHLKNRPYLFAANAAIVFVVVDLPVGLFAFVDQMFSFAGTDSSIIPPVAHAVVADIALVFRQPVGLSFGKLAASNAFVYTLFLIPISDGLRL